MKVEALKKAALVSYCKERNINPFKLTKAELISAIYAYKKEQVESAKKSKTDLLLL